MPFETTSISNHAALGTSAESVPVPTHVLDKSGNFTGPSAIGRGARVNRHAKFTNTHATNLLYVRKDAAASATAYDHLVDGGAEAVVPIGHGKYFSIYASGASTPVAVQFGNHTP